MKHPRLLPHGIHRSLCAVALLLGSSPGGADAAPRPRPILIALSDSLGHGTMDARNNRLYTSNAFVQLVADRLASHGPLFFNQPFYDENEERISPFVLPTNLSVDGSDVFTLTGLEYYERVGADTSVLTPSYLGDAPLPRRFEDDYDKVLYPLNVFDGGVTSQLDGALWLMNVGARWLRRDEAIVILWIGNNDSSNAALGRGGRNPEFEPVPLDQIARELKPLLRFLLRFGERRGDVSFEPYIEENIERGLTNLDDFQAQYESVISRLVAETQASGLERRILVGTLPYYSAVGYLVDSEDMEFYLRKLDPTYSVPPSFARVAPPGEPITDPFRGDRIALLTFGFMLALLDSGHSVDFVNGVVERNGIQRDGLVLSESEQAMIRQRIDGFNEVIRSAAAAAGPDVHVVETGPLLNGALSGQVPVFVGGRKLTRKWSRGGGLSLDGVHPGFTGQAFLANFFLQKLDAIRGTETEPYDLETVALRDPYVDQDGDGWVPGPDVASSGTQEILLLFTDPDDADPEVEVDLPEDLWDRLSDSLLDSVLRIPAIRAEAERLGAHR